MKFYLINVQFNLINVQFKLIYFQFKMKWPNLKSNWRMFNLNWNNLNFNCKYVRDRKVIVLRNCDTSGNLIDLKTSAKYLSNKPWVLLIKKPVPICKDCNELSLYRNFHQIARYFLLKDRWWLVSSSSNISQSLLASVM